eukprot:8272658-Pyramimonas_sp.AAC.1
MRRSQAGPEGLTSPQEISGSFRRPQGLQKASGCPRGSRRHQETPCTPGGLRRPHGLQEASGGPSRGIPVSPP